MGMTTITTFRAAPGKGDELAGLLTIGRDRMRDAEGCESFDLLRDENDPCAMAFVQRWQSHQAHDSAFADRIVQTGHLDKVLAVLDEAITQRTYQVAL
jgi:quinol monooxygenase YgiN